MLITTHAPSDMMLIVHIKERENVGFLHRMLGISRASTPETFESSSRDVSSRGLCLPEQASVTDYVVETTGEVSELPPTGSGKDFDQPR